MRDNNQLLDLMLKDQGEQKQLYKPGSYWTDYSIRVVDAIKTDGLAQFRSNSRIGKGYADTVSKDPFELMAMKSWKHKVHRQIINNPVFRKYFISPYLKRNEQIYRELQKYKDIHYSNILGDWFDAFSKKHDLPDTLHGEPQDTISINGKKIGSSYLTSFLRIDHYSKYIDFSRISSVLEIGGGFGAMAHSLMHLYPNIQKYVYLDIPPVVYVGTQYLDHFYGENVTDYAQTRNAEKISFSPDNNKREIISICPWQIENLDAEFDLFWNSASFQEMPEEIVKNYISHIDRLKKDNSHLCLVAYRHGNPETTIPTENLVKIAEENSAFKVKEFEATPNPNDEHFYIGASET